MLPEGKRVIVDGKAVCKEEHEAARVLKEVEGSLRKDSIENGSWIQESFTHDPWVDHETYANYGFTGDRLADDGAC